MTRKAQSFVWVDPDDCIPPHGLDMDSDRDADKVKRLFCEFIAGGFDIDMPALVGYPLDGKIQLLSGTHRHLAAKKAGIKLPVTLWLRSDVEACWGTPEWELLIEDIPVRSLTNWEIVEGCRIVSFEPVVFPVVYPR